MPLFPFALVAASFLCAEQPIPDAAALLKEVKAHQSKMDQVRENYTFHRLITTQELDPKGAVKKTTVEEREVFFVNGHQIARTIKREGKPLSDSDEQKEQERTRKLTVEATKKPSAYGNGGGVNLVSIILAEAEVSNPRRLDFHGRPTLAFDFKGNPKAEAHTMQEKGARKVAGTVWIDEADRQVARLEVEVYENFKIGGGLLANIQPGTVIKIEQSPIGEGLWMQTSNERHMNLRVVIKSVREDVKIRNFDFKRFNVDSVQQVGQPNIK